MLFQVTHTDPGSRARTGILHTSRGSIETPVFIPVGSAGTVKGVHQHELRHTVQSKIILGNTYHLFLRPGLEVLEKAGGLHAFIGWEGPILTDSGGYQVYSLSKRRKITESGVQFSSHLDGSIHHFTPERVVDIQNIIGADITMAFDECTPFPCDIKVAEQSMNRTHRWLVRGNTHFNELTPMYGCEQYFIPIIQGSVYPELRKISTEEILKYPSVLYAIGGLSVGEPSETLYQITDLICSMLPAEKPRYLMGVGTPADLLECISLGIDMFDCVLPTRNARHGHLFTSEGIINIKNRKWANAFEPIDSALPAVFSMQYSKAYLRHLIISGELLGAQIASLHNLCFYQYIIHKAREKIMLGCFQTWKRDILKKVNVRI
jgi:queuine tRNA-ribosyltransferase